MGEISSLASFEVDPAWQPWQWGVRKKRDDDYSGQRMSPRWADESFSNTQLLLLCSVWARSRYRQDTANDCEGEGAKAR